MKEIEKRGGKRQEEILLERQKDEKKRKVAPDGVISAAEGNVLNEST